ncbi:MAG TPA: bacteriohemerythrin [Coriobacteriia bacterium]|nr:bacteriohemerythrin [Coriobacteriia bacterium]
MSNLQWDSSLDTGHKLVDEQHRSLLALIGEVFDASRSFDVDITARALEALSSYVVVHFDAEESLMREHGYPDGDAEAHRAEHRDLTTRTRELVLEFREQPQIAAVELSSFLIEWLTHHIEHSDRKLVEHVRSVDG